MVTIFVAMFLIAIAVPSFKNITASSRLTSTANSMVGALHVARMEAIKRNARTQFCANAGNGADTLGTACATQTAAVYTLAGASGAETAVEVLAPLDVARSGQEINGTMWPVQFEPDGLTDRPGESAPYTGKIADIDNPDAGSSSHRLVCMITGSIVHVLTTDGSVKCSK